MDEHSSRFLDAFAMVENHLRRTYKAQPHVSFVELVNRGSQKDRTLRYYRDDLLEMAELRNAITHRYRRDEPIATPHLATVEEMEVIKQDLLAPPKLGSRFAREVEACTADEPVGTVSRRMLAGGFSQVPVRW